MVVTGKVVKVVTVDNQKVVNSDNFDNFSGDNHKVVTVTTFLTPI